MNPSRTTRHLAAWIALLLTVALVVVLEARRRPPAPVGADAPAERFSAARALDVLERVLGAEDGGVEPHPSGTPAADRVRRRIVDELVAMGIDPSRIGVQRDVACRESERWSFVGCAPVENLLVRLPGPQEGPAVLLVAHYDGVAAGPAVSDDGAGVATLLEVARALLAADGEGGGGRLHPVVLLFPDAEERGLYGARAFLQHHPLARPEAVGAVINLEARGTTGSSLLFQASPDDAWIVDHYRRSPRPATSSLYAEIYRRLPNDTDLTPFLEAGYAGVNFAYAEGLPRYHTPRDSLEYLDRGSLQHHGDNVLAMTRALAADPELAAPPPGRAVYVDVAGLFILAYPLGWALPLAVVVLLGIGLLVVFDLRRGDVSWRALAVAVLVVVLLPVVAGVAAFALGRLAELLAGSARPGWAHPLPLRVALWSLVFLVAALLAAAAGRLGRRFPDQRSPDQRFPDQLSPDKGGVPRALALAAWLLLAFLGVVLAAVAPGVSIYAVAPAAVALVAAGLVALVPALRDARWAWETAVVAAALAAAFFWLQVALFVELGMGAHRVVLLAVPVALAAAPYTALFAPPPGRGRWLLPAVLAAAVVLGLAVTAVVAPYSEAAPQGVSVVHHQEFPGDAESGEAAATARLYLDVGADPPPDVMLAAAPFGDAPEETPDHLRVGRSRSADTAPAELGPPGLEVLAVEALPDGRRVRFRLRGSFDRWHVHLPEHAGPGRFRVGGHDYALGPGDPFEGSHVVSCYGRSCAELDFTLDLGSTEPVEAELFATRYASSRPLPPAARAVADARPAWAVPIHEGDRTALQTTVRLELELPVTPDDGAPPSPGPSG